MTTATLQVSGVAGGLVKRTHCVEAQDITLSKDGWQPLACLSFTAQHAGIHTIEVSAQLEFDSDCGIGDAVSIGINCEREGVRSTFAASQNKTQVIVRDLLPLREGETVFVSGLHRAHPEMTTGRATLRHPRLTATRGPDTEV